MTKKREKKFLIALSIGTAAFGLTFCHTFPVFAEQKESALYDKNGEEDTSATNGDYDYTKDEEYTQSFYHPKSFFQSSYDYEEYCKRMYNMGYMDSDYEWTPAAQNFIDNMNGDNMKALDENAKEIVNQRVEDGEMKAEDNPYLTYDEKQRLIEKESKNAESEDTENANVSEEPSPSGEAAKDSTTESKSDVTITPETEENEEQNKNNHNTANKIRIVIMAVLAIVIALITYSIYRRQF